MSTEWEALPQRTRKRRSFNNSSNPNSKNDSNTTSEINDNSNDHDNSNDDDNDDIDNKNTNIKEERAQGCSKDCDAEDGRERRTGGEKNEARDAAVATAVEARSRMFRFSGGLESGAGADGANFECEDYLQYHVPACHISSG